MFKNLFAQRLEIGIIAKVAELSEDEVKSYLD